MSTKLNAEMIDASITSVDELTEMLASDDVYCASWVPLRDDLRARPALLLTLDKSISLTFVTTKNTGQFEFILAAKVGDDYYEMSLEPFAADLLFQKASSLTHDLLAQEREHQKEMAEVRHTQLLVGILAHLQPQGEQAASDFIMGIVRSEVEARKTIMASTHEDRQKWFERVSKVEEQINACRQELEQTLLD